MRHEGYDKEFLGEALGLDEMLADPLVRLVMKSDGVAPQEVRALMRAARERVAPAFLVPPAHVISACREFGRC